MRFFYITLLILVATLAVPDFAFAAPSECPAVEYVEIVDADGTSGDDFITISAGNLINIDAKGGNDCIVVGNDNTKTISGGSGNDVMIVGDNNDGNIESNGDNDTLIIGNGNKKNISGGDGTDTITIGSNNLGDVESNGGSDILNVGTGNQGNISGGDGEDHITVTDNNTGDISGNGDNDTIVVSADNQGKISGGGGEDEITVGDNNIAEVSGEGNDDTISVGNENSGHIKGGGGNDTVVVGEDNSGPITTEGGDDDIVFGCGNTGEVEGGGGNDTIKTSCLPVASPLPGIFTSIQQVSLTAEDAASIYYTTDGTTPSCLPVAGTLYESPITISSTKTLTVLSCSEEGWPSLVATFAYTIELEITPADLSSILEAVFAPAPGASISLSFTLTLSQDLEINTTASGSKIVLNEATVITRADGLELNAASLSSSETDIGLLSGLTEGQVFEGALQWGIPNITLEFDQPITISIFVGTDLDGQTLSVVRSATGTDSWTDDGIESPATCTISAGICSFRATKASYYATYT